MLVLTRHPGERIFLNPGTPEQIVIVVTKIDRGTVRLGIRAPDGVVIMREELLPDAPKATTPEGE